MPAARDYTGHRNGGIVVIGQAPRRGRYTYWRCRCDCGSIFDTNVENIRNGKKTNCGCGIVGRGCQFHGLSKHPLYAVWKAIRSRCSNPKSAGYPRYGARGIKVCAEWLDFMAFFAWANANGYERGLSIERLDYDGDYSPDNCTWIPRAAQSRNRSSNVSFVINGVRKCLKEITDERGANYERVRERIHGGMPLEEALSS